MHDEFGFSLSRPIGDVAAVRIKHRGADKIEFRTLMLARLDELPVVPSSAIDKLATIWTEHRQANMLEGGTRPTVPHDEPLLSPPGGVGKLATIGAEHHIDDVAATPGLGQGVIADVVVYRASFIAPHDEPLVALPAR